MQSHATEQPVPKGPGKVEFILLMAATMSLVALCIDAMLPAFGPMAADLDVASLNDMQFVILTLFVGLALGQLFYGPLSDSIGRLPAMHAGFALMAAGTLVGMFTDDFMTLLAGRFLQGFGAAGPRTVSMALVRDRFQGAQMARIMSFIVTVFVLVPILAPAVGQAILLVSGWRMIFGFTIVFTLLVQAWLLFRQPETLPRKNRRSFTFSGIAWGFREVVTNLPTMTYTVIAGCIFGSLMGYLNSCQQVFQVQYGLGKLFPLYFAGLVFTAGIASVLNGSLVMRFGMHLLTFRALYFIAILAWLLLLTSWFTDGHPPLWQFMLLMSAWFFGMGVVFGNINAMAMEEMGHVAGSAAAVIGTLSTLIAVGLGYLVGNAYDGSVMPLALGFATLTSALSLIHI